MSESGDDAHPHERPAGLRTAWWGFLGALLVAFGVVCVVQGLWIYALVLWAVAALVIRTARRVARGVYPDGVFAGAVDYASRSVRDSRRR